LIGRENPAGLTARRGKVELLTDTDDNSRRQRAAPVAHLGLHC
jgi:hypothetical protein